MRKGENENDTRKAKNKKVFKVDKERRTEDSKNIRRINTGKIGVLLDIQEYNTKKNDELEMV